ncbi:MAG: zinc-dependent metalloprotease [Bacteroidota bacterium]
MKTRTTLLMASVFVFAQCASKKTTQSPKMPPPADGGNKSKTASIKEKTKNCTKSEGLFTLYKDTITGNAYMVVKKAQLGKEFIYFNYAENGLVLTGHFRGAYRDNEVFSLRKVYDRIEFVKENTGFYFDSTNAISKSATANISPSILLSEKVVAEDTAKGEYLLEADAIFLTEGLSKIKPTSLPTPMAAFMFNMGGLSKTKTKYSSIRNYPENTDIVVDYVFDNPSPVIGGGPEVTDARSVTVTLQHSFIEVPANNFTPRYDDPRVGYFTHEVNDMTTESVTPYRDVIHRWHLEKKNPELTIDEPVTPITWWIENTTPIEYRETIKQAGLKWNQAFEKAGFKNAVKVEIQPDTATWDAGDIRYNVLRWTSSPNPPFGGYGPSFVNPRTGQILGADIMLEYIYITNRLKQNDVFGTIGLEGMLNEMNDNHDKNVGHYCEAGHYLHQTTLFGLYGMMVNNATQADKDEFIKQSLHYLILHEMGHTLGLNHNMKASQMLSPAELADKNTVETFGLIGSVMDYPATNFRLDGKKQTNYFTTKPGPYDDWAIEFGYSTAEKDADAEKKRLEKILSRSTEPKLIFGNDADDMRSPGKAIDPRVNVNDLSNDAIGYMTERMQIANKVMGEIKNKFSIAGKSYQQLRTAYLVLSSEYAGAASVISRYIGGVYVDRSMVGQQGATQPYTPVKYEDQKRAMKTLAENVFAPNALKASDNLYQYLQEQRRGFNFFSSTEDPKIHDRALAIQNTALTHILHPTVMERLTDSRMYGNKYSVNEMLTDLNDAIFKEDLSSNVNTIRQNLQIAYTKKLITIFDKTSVYDNISKSAALAAIQSILSQMRVAKLKGDAETKAHREHVIFIIEKALKAE